MEETLRQHLLALADAYATAKSCSIWAVGRECMKDGSFFPRMKTGDGFTVKTFDRVVIWFVDNWPAGAVWPTDVPRPDPTPAADAPREVA